MTHQAPLEADPSRFDPAHQMTRLREVTHLVKRIAGTEGRVGAVEQLDQAARLSASYDRALPVVQRRFAALATETACWAAAGVEVLLGAGGGSAPPRAAAARLAAEIDRAIDELNRMIDS